MGHIERHDIGWLLARVKGMDALLASPLLSTVLSSGAYIAGGFVRKLVRDRSTAGLFKFFDKSDVDIFFRDEKSYYDTRVALEALGIKQSHWKRTSAGNAWTTMLPSRLISLENCSVRCQLIDCRLDEPAGMLGSFDFANCCFAFDAKSVWFDDAALDLEASRKLHVQRATDLLGSRVIKYFGKDEYDCLTPSSRKMLIGWVDDLEQRQWITPPGGRQIIMGERVVLGLAKLGLFDDKKLVNYIGKFRSSVLMATQADSYGALHSIPPKPLHISHRVPPAPSSWFASGIPSSSASQKYYAYADEIELILNEPNTRDIKEGDMVETVPGALGDARGAVIVVSRFRNTDHWHVLSPTDGTAWIMPRHAFTRVVSRYDGTTE